MKIYSFVQVSVGEESSAEQSGNEQSKLRLQGEVH